MANTKYVYMTGKASYARLREDNRDMGENLPDGDQKRNIEAVQGKYVMNLFVDRETKLQGIKDGLPKTGMSGQLWKEDDEGNIFYKCTRQHFNPKFVNEEKGQDGILGAPKVVIKTENGLEPYTGNIGNDSIVTVKLSVWNESKVELQAVRIDELVEWETVDNDEDYF